MLIRVENSCMGRREINCIGMLIRGGGGLHGNEGRRLDGKKGW
jgi:hypothetical protein